MNCLSPCLIFIFLFLLFFPQGSFRLVPVGRAVNHFGKKVRKISPILLSPKGQDYNSVSTDVVHDKSETKTSVLGSLKEIEKWKLNKEISNSFN